MRKRSKKSSENKKNNQDFVLNTLKYAQRTNKDIFENLLKYTAEELEKIEYDIDNYIFCMQNILKSRGGELEIRFKFPHVVIKVASFEDFRKEYL